MKGSPDFDVLGHLDILRRYGEARATRVTSNLYSLLDKVLQWLIENKKALEFNSSGYRYGLESPHPELWVFERYFALGGRLVTFGSDAHRPEDVGHRHRESLENLRRIGFSQICAYSHRQPVFWNIP